MTVSSTLDKAPTAAAEARRMIDSLNGHLAPEQKETARLLVTEVVTNAVRHVDRDGAIAVVLHVDDARVRVEVADPGSGFTPRPRGPDAPLDGQWGLHFLEVLADRWGIEAGERHTVWFELPRATG